MRLIFGPAKGYTTSIWDYFHEDENYFTNPIKTLGLPECFSKKQEAELFSFELYMKDYQFDKPYIDCSLLYFNETDYFKKCFGIFNIFNKTSIIYNLRSLKQLIFSFYYMAKRDKFSAFKNDDQLLSFLFYRYDLRNFLHFYDYYKNSTYELYFIQDFNIDEIIDYFNLVPINKKMKCLNFGLIEHKCNSNLLMSYNDVREEFELLFSKNTKKYNEILKSNIDIIKTHKIIGKFDDQKYRKS